MEILIGRENGSSRLSVVVNGKPGSMNMGAEVPQSVSRYKPEEGSAHCRLLISSSGRIIIENLNERNVTYVDGAPIHTQKKVTDASIVELGADQFRIDLRKLLKAVGFRRSYSLAPLEKIWERYDRQLLDLQLEQQKKQNQQRLQGILSMSGMLCAVIPSVIPSIPIPEWVRLAVIVSALAMAIYFYRRGSNTSETFVVKKRELDAWFRSRYVCQNPKCNHFLGFQPFDSIADRKKCPYCDCELRP